METTRSSYKKKFREDNPEKYKLQRRNERLKKYGIDEVEFQKILNSQSGNCKCCGEKLKDTKNIHIDYELDKNRIKGLLCAKCSVTIRYLKSAAFRAKAIIEYLSK